MYLTLLGATNLAEREVMREMRLKGAREEPSGSSLWPCSLRQYLFDIFKKRTFLQSKKICNKICNGIAKIMTDITGFISVLLERKGWIYTSFAVKKSQTGEKASPGIEKYIYTMGSFIGSWVLVKAGVH
jgi:hypothetical protein